MKKCSFRFVGFTEQRPLVFLAGAVRFNEAEKNRFAALWNEAKSGVMFKDRNVEG